MIDGSMARLQIRKNTGTPGHSHRAGTTGRLGQVRTVRSLKSGGLTLLLFHA